MSELRSDLVRQKLQGIRFDLTKLRKLCEEAAPNLEEDEDRRTTAERRVERIVGRAIDTNLHLIRASGGPAPSDYRTSFRSIGELGIIPADLATKLSPSAGARNVLVHEYNGIEIRQFVHTVESALRLFPKYIKAVEAYLSSQEKK